MTREKNIMFLVVFTFCLAQTTSGRSIWKRSSEADSEAGYFYGGHLRSFPVDNRLSAYSVPYTTSYKTITSYHTPVLATYHSPYAHSYAKAVDAVAAGHIHRDVAKYILGIDDHRNITPLNNGFVTEGQIGQMASHLGYAEQVTSHHDLATDGHVSSHSTHVSGHVVGGGRDNDDDPTTFTAEDGTKFVSEDGITFTSPDGSTFTRNDGGHEEEGRSGQGEQVQEDYEAEEEVHDAEEGQEPVYDEEEGEGAQE